MTTWYMGGGSVLAGCLSTTTAPCPSSGFGVPRGGTTGGVGGSAGMDSFYRVDGLQSQAVDIASRGQTSRPEMRHVRWCVDIGDAVFECTKGTGVPLCRLSTGVLTPPVTAAQNCALKTTGGGVWPSGPSSGSTTPKASGSSNRRGVAKTSSRTSP